jgi:hypothetical protein
MRSKYLSSVGHLIRELALYKKLFSLSPENRTIMFLPSDGKQMSALLRAYNIAEGLAARGWNCIVIPKQLEQTQRRRLYRAFKPDLLFLQTSRHPLNDPLLLDGIPYVYDLDDADFHNSLISKRIESTVSGALGVIAGSRYIAEWCKNYSDNVSIIWTGAPITKWDRPKHNNRAPIVTWAQSRPAHYTREFAWVTRVMKEVAAARTGVRLRLYGWHDGDTSPHLKELEEHGVEVELYRPLSYSKFVHSLGEVSVGLSPICIDTEFNRGKSFGKILAYLDAKVPVLASDEADHSLFFDNSTGIVSNDERIWVEEILSLLSDHKRRNEMSENAFIKFSDLLSLEAAARKVDMFIRKLLNS